MIDKFGVEPIHSMTVVPITTITSAAATNNIAQAIELSFKTEVGNMEPEKIYDIIGSHSHLCGYDDDELTFACSNSNIIADSPV